MHEFIDILYNEVVQETDGMNEQKAFCKTSLS